jgi:DNA-directed RNA polymerase specialized sigma24 family protein
MSHRSLTRGGSQAEQDVVRFSIAYRVLGSASDAEDAVQDAYLRWRGAAEMRDAEAYLVRVWCGS